MKEYVKNGIPIWGLTVENEPSMGLLKHYAFQALGLTSEMERDFIKKDLGPALSAAGLDGVALMIFDDNRRNLRAFGDTVHTGWPKKKNTHVPLWL